jgi:hypothetical protein
MDRPVKFNAKGKYNLNFIDWQNEYQAIIEGNYDPENPQGDSPIIGMSMNTFHNLMLEESRKMAYEQDQVEREINGMASLEHIKKMKIGKSEKECSICIKKFIQGEIIRLLKCKHIFHDACLLPWLDKHSQCPNCRSDLK